MRAFGSDAASLNLSFSCLSLFLLHCLWPTADDSGNATTVTYYDWKAGANLIQITPDSNESAVLWDLELTSGHSYYYTPSSRSCFRIEMPVGILRPDWLVRNSTCLGERIINGRKAIGWTKLDFIDYWADSSNGSPLSWYFHSMRARFDTVFFSPGTTAPSRGLFTPPNYCDGNHDGGEGGGVGDDTVGYAPPPRRGAQDAAHVRGAQPVHAVISPAQPLFTHGSPARRADASFRPQRSSHRDMANSSLL